MKVCLFGGSFDPPHLKHVQIVEDLLEAFDEVWIIVAAASPFKASHFVSFKNRFEMCEIAFNDERVKVLDVEEKHHFKYTYDTVKYLCDNYTHDFSFALGSDNSSTLKTWYKISELEKLVDFVVFERTAISSTLVRIARDSKIAAINDYIISNNLYDHNYASDFAKLKSVVSERRFNHSVYVYDTILKIAKANNLDLHKCALAAIYHDYCKDMATDEYLLEFKKNHPQYANNGNQIMHGVVASYLLDLDEDILEAIKYHSTGKTNPSDLLKALYISDFCEPSRYFHSDVVYILVQSYSDLDKAYELCIEVSRKYVLELHGVVERLD